MFHAVNMRLSGCLCGQTTVKSAGVNIKTFYLRQNKHILDLNFFMHRLNKIKYFSNTIALNKTFHHEL